MTETTQLPGHFRAIAILALLGTGCGAADFVMTNARVAGYIAGLPAVAIQNLDSMPYETIGAWLLGVGTALLGALLLVARSRFAVAAFAVSLVGLAACTVDQVGVAAGPAALSRALAVLLLWYAVLIRKGGVLR